ncbi:Flagellar basal-body rod modification protein FlgD [Brevinematales bacterium NS]|nr:Flagellar basal-body rod modification protein FlgD [Brevinematales bacterium NS]
MNINTQMSPAELQELTYKVEGFNAQIRAQNQGSKNSLSEADFMKLLITQLRNQDPTKPLEDKEFITQMTQLTSLKQLNEMITTMQTFSKELAFTRTLGLVNKWVVYERADGVMAQGLVESIRVKNGQTFLNVNNEEVTLEQVSEIAAPVK